MAPGPSDQLTDNTVPGISQGTASPAAGQETGAARPAEALGDDRSAITRRDLMAVSTDLKQHISTLLEGFSYYGSSGGRGGSVELIASSFVAFPL